jgi:energy-coupling factor transport system permease protein
MLFATLLTFTTSTIELNDGLESLLKPLRIFRIKTAAFSMMLSLTFRAIPTLILETNRIMKAQTSRGADFKESNLIKKLNLAIALLVPIFVVSFKRAEDLADAMEVRGYIYGGERTKIDIYKLKLKDYLALLLIFGMLAGYIVYAVMAI